jgi:DUF4097 and DUF4098 domain-containing protein YvlB
MPVFDTPGPIDVRVELGVGNVRCVASDRTDTVVDVTPSRNTEEDETAVEQTRVELVSGRLLVKAPKGWRYFGPSSKSGSVEVTIELPTGSRLEADAGMARIGATGRLGDADVKTGGGNITLETVGTLRARTGFGDVTVEASAGAAHVSTGSGRVRLGEATGATVIKNSNGDSWLGEARADVRVNSANGDIEIDHTHSSVVAKTAYGDVELGIPHGTSAYMDLTTAYGNVRSELEPGAQPEASTGKAQIRGRTGYGDITVRRA